ncbi:MAG TPA: tetrahydromethanopterin S-methyltransferase subunit C [Methanothermobacter sp.]|jgi:tetrahydromethanopterin S-methyltransferase subunit C|uniref:Tetrahydromethanopterin S-methyltransferase subunit C n=1 Tax=Methanothermobacter tenebrarum TaxID=680118 RepID=A0ABM7YAK3_9EURY|nr:tetrahydromethanopterin S-methyltransferase subunit C [Methanothermobacter tenebrarum]MDX9694044.1 tetrahydromethanopterin S-methyltransferase subunit C [Methanothermobacter sp.]BDH78882.1 tetrahydromethanopterin S-methyltransferase subunit C [Methanothermobacter tenebrarum]HHW17090.1 tetrahydromethanopterin S-methyltransferase subunit C [Methanothermobacter sp.]
MTVAAGGPTAAAIPESRLLALGIIGGLVGIYLFGVPVIGSLLACLGAVCAIVWGADAIRRVASYGLGTGVPSIGYMSVAIGIVGLVAGIATPMVVAVPNMAIPIIGLILAMILGAIVGFLGQKVLKMKIPILTRCTAEISGAAALSVLGFLIAIAGNYTMKPVVSSVVATGFIALLFILNTMAIQHPFNACLGPNENQRRTLKLAAACGFLSMAVIGLLSVTSNPGWWLVLLVGAIGWLIAFRAFVGATFEDAASVKWTGLWPKEEEFE